MANRKRIKRSPEFDEKGKLIQSDRITIGFKPIEKTGFRKGSMAIVGNMIVFYDELGNEIYRQVMKKRG